MKKKIAKRMIIIVSGIVALMIIASAFILTKNMINSNDAKQQKQEAENYQNWLANNCQCLSYEKYFCMNESFAPVGKFCYDSKDNIFTNALADCSVYSCFGQNITWNNQTERWENETK
ncbi:MAG TPA: hypothetical protein VMC07_01430 [Candidatus Omnitrophota bacterium]|nr:hypothetical protein [Candidatus Omnitrophota bacterium]